MAHSLVGTMTKECFAGVTSFGKKKVFSSHTPTVVIHVSAYVCQQIPEAHYNIEDCLFKLCACSKAPPLRVLDKTIPPDMPYLLAEWAHIRP